MSKTVIIGGGAAGLMAAVCAAKNGHNVIVVEKMERPARKIMITGKGRCNVTNDCDNATLIANMTKNGRFLYSAFSAFSSADTIDFFESCKVPLKTERGNRVFPVSDKSVDIADALVSSCKGIGVKFIRGEAAEILVKDNSVTGVLLKNGDEIKSDAVILATGGKSYPLTGSTGDGYIMAEKLGHTVTELVPSLVPLKIHQSFCAKIMGLTLKNVELSVYFGEGKKPVYQKQGEMLFTHFGISGPLVLSASAHMRKNNGKDYKLFIDLKPALTDEQLYKRLNRDFLENSNKNLVNSLDKLLPKSLISIIINLSGVSPDTKVNQITKKQRAEICRVIKALPLNSTGFRDIEEAIVTSGGINVKEINPATMESKLINNLFFAGEIIDVDAYTGGFNLQIAFSTGYLAGGSVK